MKTDAWLRAFVFCGLRLWSSFCVFCVWTVRARSSKLEHKIFARFLLSKIVIFHLTHLRFSTTPQGVRTTPQGVRPLKGCAPSRGAPPQGVRPLKGCAPSRGAPPSRGAKVRPLKTRNFHEFSDRANTYVLPRGRTLFALRGTVKYHLHHVWDASCLCLWIHATGWIWPRGGHKYLLVPNLKNAQSVAKFGRCARPLKGCAPSRGAPPQGVRPLKGCAPWRGAPPQGVRKNVATKFYKNVATKICKWVKWKITFFLHDRNDKNVDREPCSHGPTQKQNPAPR